MEAKITTKELHETLMRRYATKMFKKGEKIPEEKWAAVEEAMLYAPTSSGLQPVGVVVVEEAGIREKLREASYGQAQITDASKIVIFCARTNVEETDAQRLVERIAEVRRVGVETMEGFRGMVAGMIKMHEAHGGPAAVEAWAARQVYILLGFLLTSAALLGLDACPMEGFDPSKYDQILGLSKRGLAAKAVAAVGFRDPADKYATLPKVRFPADKIIIHL